MPVPKPNTPVRLTTVQDYRPGSARAALVYASHDYGLTLAVSPTISNQLSTTSYPIPERPLPAMAGIVLVGVVDMILIPIFNRDYLRRKLHMERLFRTLK